MVQLHKRSEGQPLTHQILEALDVLERSSQDDIDDPNGDWQTFDHHPPDHGIMDTSTTSSPTLQDVPPSQLKPLPEPVAPQPWSTAQQPRSMFATNQPTDYIRVHV